MTIDHRLPRRRLLRRRDTARPSEHRLTYLDQTALELARVTGRGQLMQCVWVYEHPLNYEGIERFNRNLYQSLGSRLIERSPLAFGRHRWVRQVGSPPPVRIAERSRSRAELMVWCDELAELPIDPEHGPGWHLAVQTLDDGATAVSIVASHMIADGVGALMAVFEAITGSIRNPGYDQPGARTRTKAVVADLRQVVRDLPEAARTAVKAATVFRAKRDELAVARTAHVSAEDSRRVVVPTVAIYVDIAEWDTRATSLGGNSYSLLAGLAAKLADRYGRRRADGQVSLSIAINLRESLDDDRALAMAFANAIVDPATADTDLTDVRAAVRQAREKAKNEPDPTIALLSIVPWLPRSAIKGLAELMFSYSEGLPVSCSNLGDLPPDLARVDGTEAEYVFIRALDTKVTMGDLKRSQGQLVVVSGRINGKVSIAVEAYQLDAVNTKERLREVAAQTLNDFGLTGVIT